MTKTSLRFLACLAVLAVPSIAAAQGGATNDAKLKPGIALVKAHDYDKAVASLSKAYASTKDARALYWIGRAHQENARNADALRAYKQYLKEASLAPADPRSIEVLGNIQTLSMQLAVVIVTATEGATITVDDVEVGKAPLPEALYVEPGKHAIAATLDARSTSKPIDVATESRSTVDLVFVEKPKPAAALVEQAPAAKPEPSPARSTAMTPSRSRVDAVTIGGLGVATALAAGSVFFGVKALGTASDFDAKKGELGASRDDLDALQNETRMQAGLSLGLGLAAIGAAGVTLFVLKKPTSETAPASRVIVTGQGVGLAGSF
jgi:tetratricopeptide (TPR) repeat protein